MPGNSHHKHKNPTRISDKENTTGHERRGLYDQLEAMFSQSLDIIGSGNLDGHFLKINPAVERILGYSGEEFRTHPFLHFVHPDDYKKTEEVLRSASRGKEEIFIENRYRCKDGTFKWIDWSVFVNPDEESFIAVGRDISERKETEEQLRLQSEIINNIAEGVFLCRHDDLNIVYANPKFEKMFGYSPGEIIGKPTSVVNAPTTVSPQEKAMDIFNALNVEGEWHGEIENIKKDGTCFWTYAKISTFDHSIYGKVYVNVHADISARKEAEVASARNAELFRVFVEGTDNLVAQVDTKGNLTYVNNAAEKIFGLKSEQCLGLSAFEFTHPDDRGKTKMAFFDWVRNLTANITFENRQVSRKGEIHHMLWTINLYFNDQGDVIKVNNIGRDITELKKAEQELESLSKKHEMILASTGDGIYGVDLQGNTTFANPAATRMIGWSKNEILGKNQHDILHHTKPDGTPYLQEECPIYSALSDGVTRHVDNEVFWRKDGTHFPVEYISAPIKEKDVVLGAVVTFRDITNRKKYEDELKNAKRMLEERVNERTRELQITHSQLIHSEKLSAIGQLSASIAHEFNNPLAGVINVLQGIQKRARYDEDDGKMLSLAVGECNRMKDLIRNLQDFNKPSTGVPSLADIHSMIDSIILLYKKVFQKNRITVRKEYDKQMPNISVVNDQIKQVILNLLTNAVEACKNGGEIVIITEARQDTVCIKISDNGKGIKEEDKAHIFEPFFTTRPEVSGTGLGLPISDSIIRDHKGLIDFESEEGKGCLFSITLPINGAADG